MENSWPTTDKDGVSPETEMDKDARKSDVIGVFPTTPVQNLFWYQNQTDPNPGAGNIDMRWDIRGKVRNDSIDGAIQTVAARHEILRTRFVEQDGLPRQEVLQRPDIDMASVDLQGIPAHLHENRIDEIACELATEPFDLTTPSLIRFTLVRTAPERASLLIVAHHTVFDGFSMRVLGHEIGTAAAAFEEGQPHNLAELQLQYADYALWQEEMGASPAREASAEYWKSQLQDAPYFEVEPDFPGTEQPIREARRIEIAFADSFGGELAEFAKANDTSPFVLGSAVAAAALHRFSGQTDISFGTAIAGRDEIELEDLIGVFINPVALRFRVGETETLAAVVAQGNDVVRGALAHGDYPFETLIRTLKRPRVAGRTPLVSVFFALQREFLQEKDHGGFCITPVASETPQLTYDLIIQLLGQASGWRLRIDYDSARFDQRSVTLLGHLIHDGFKTLLADPAARIGDIPFAGREKTGRDQPGNLTRAPALKPGNPPVLRVVKTAPPPETEAPPPKSARLAAIWSEILGLPAEQCDGDFFDLGGHSIIVLRMLARVQVEFGVRVPLLEFLENPTLQGVAASIEKAQENRNVQTGASNWEVITLRNGQPNAPLVVSVNQPFLYHKVARKFEDHCRVINLHISNERYFEAGNRTALGEIVRDAATRIESEAAGRPVVLIGHCVDGLMGLSIAQTLKNSGTKVLSLAMVDSWAPNCGEGVGPVARRYRRMQSKFRRWWQYICLKARGDIGWQEFLSKSAACSKMLVLAGLQDRPTGTELKERRVNGHLMGLFQNHRFAPYGGEVILFKTESHTNEAIACCFGWQEILSPDTPVYPLRGWHEDSMLWHGFDRIADVIEGRLRHSGGQDTTPRLPVIKG